MWFVHRLLLCGLIAALGCKGSSGTRPDSHPQDMGREVAVVEVTYDFGVDSGREVVEDSGSEDFESSEFELGSQEDGMQVENEPYLDLGEPDETTYDEGPCIPNCEGKVCGPDGCGGICGYCQYGKVCKDGQCIDICIPDCIEKGKLCGPDGCGGECPPGCQAGFECRDDFRCHPVECVPDCTGRVCGYGANGGCGNPKECGECAPGQSCTDAGQCVEGPCMGIDPKIGKCLDAFTVAYCSKVGGQDVLITLDCKQYPDKVCGWDVWEGKYACIDKPPCVPKCTLDDGTKKECGDDGCGGQCGTCPLGWGCPGFKCRPVPGASCGWITETGTCWYDNWLYYCTGPVNTGKIAAENCTELGKVCAYDDQYSHSFQCMTKPR